MGLKTPVVILSYKRPDALRQVLASCPDDRSYLFVSDGWKSDLDKPLVLKCRELFSGFHTRSTKEMLFRDKNLGGPVGIPDALDFASKIFDYFIVLEDDTVPSPLFFDWVDSSIELIGSDSKIGMLSGCNFPEAIKKIKFDQCQLSKFPETWGWATTSKMWHEVRNTKDQEIFGLDLSKIFPSKKVVQHFERIRDAQLEREIWNWDYRLFFAFWSLKYFCLISPVNLIKNIGFGDDAANMKNKTRHHYLNNNKLFQTKFMIEDFSTYDWNIFDQVNFNVNHGVGVIDSAKSFIKKLIKS